MSTHDLPRDAYRTVRPEEAPIAIAISVVVPTCHRARLLDHCLAALTMQSLAADAYEIIVADDANDPATQAQVANWAAHADGRPRIVYVPVRDRHGPAAARNLGWRAARGAIVAFTNDDTVAQKDWLAAGLAAMCGDVAAAAGGVHVPLPNARGFADELAASGPGEGEFATANCFVRRDALAAIGGFDPRFTAAWRGDSDLFFALLEVHGSVVAAPDAVVVHRLRPAQWGASLRQQRQIMFDALLYKKHRKLYRQKIHAAPPWRYYATVLSLALLVAAIAAGSAPTALGAGAIWLALTAHFVAQRLRATSRAPAHVAEMIVTAILVPPLAIFWRLVGAVRFRALFA